MLLPCFAWNVSWKQGTSPFENISVWARKKYICVTHLKINICPPVAACVSVGEGWQCFDFCQLSFFIWAVTWPPASWISESLQLWHHVLILRWPLGTVSLNLMWLHRALAPELPRGKWQRTSNQNRHVLAELKQDIRNREVNPLVESCWASIHLTSSHHSFEMYFSREVNRTNEPRKKQRGQRCSNILDQKVQISSEPREGLLRTL